MWKLSTLPKWLRQIGAVWIAFVVFWYIADIGLDGSRGQKYHEQLRREFQLIQPLPGSAVIRSYDDYSRLTPGKAGVGADYASKAHYATIFQYYDPELNSKGWRFVEEHPVRTMYGDFGGMQRNYCKGPLSATLDYAGPRAQYGWTYAFGLSWGVRKCDQSR